MTSLILRYAEDPATGLPCLEDLSGRLSRAELEALGRAVEGDFERLAGGADGQLFDLDQRSLSVRATTIMRDEHDFSASVFVATRCGRHSRKTGCASVPRGRSASRCGTAGRTARRTCASIRWS